jgi:hypothetical protein
MEKKLTGDYMDRYTGLKSRFLPNMFSGAHVFNRMTDFIPVLK